MHSTVSTQANLSTKTRTIQEWCQTGPWFHFISVGSILGGGMLLSCPTNPLYNSSKNKIKKSRVHLLKIRTTHLPKSKLNRTLKPHLKSTLLTHHSPARECMKILDEQRSTGTEIESGFCFFLNLTLLYFVCFILHIHDTHSTAYACMKVQPSRATKDQRGQHMCPSIS